MKAHPIEVLGLGQQFVAFADHPDTRRPYEWPQESPADLPAESLPLVDEAMIRAFLDQAQALVPPELRPGRLPGEPAARAGAVAAGELRGTPEAIADALRVHPQRRSRLRQLGPDRHGAQGRARRGRPGSVRRLVGDLAARTCRSSPPRPGPASSPSASAPAPSTITRSPAAGSPDPALVLNGGILVNGRHPARALLERLCGAGRAERRPRPPPPQRTPVDPRMFELDGALELFVDYILASAVRPQPILAIGASLCALGALMGRKYRTQTNLRTNLYVVGMAGSGGGKDHARGAIKEAFIAAGLQRYLGGNRIASGSGLLTALYRQPSSLFQLDEFGQFLGNIVNKRHAPKYLAEIWDLLTELSTSAGGTFFGAEYADQKQRPRQDIAQPCCCVHAHHRAGAVLGGAAGGLDGRRQPRPLPGVPDRRRRARPQPAAEADRRRAGRAGRGAAGDRRRRAGAWPRATSRRWSRGR